MKLSMARSKKGLPEDEEVFFAHLARKVSAINVLTPQLTKELAERIKRSFQKNGIAVIDHLG